MEATLNMLNDIGNKIEISAFNGISNLTPYMLGLLVLLATIAIATEWDMYFSNTWNWGNLITKIIHIGMIAFFIRNWPQILSMVKKSAEKLGMLAGGANVAYTPSNLLISTLNDIYAAFGTLWDKFSFLSHPPCVYLCGHSSYHFPFGCFPHCFCPVHGECRISDSGRSFYCASALWRD